jgi:hypothetical protein
MYTSLIKKLTRAVFVFFVVAVSSNAAGGLLCNALVDERSALVFELQLTRVFGRSGGNPY